MASGVNTHPHTSHPHPHPHRHDHKSSSSYLDEIRKLESNEPGYTHFHLTHKYNLSLSKKEWKHIGSALAKNDHVVHVDLAGCSMDDERMSLVFQQAVKNGRSNIQSLCLRGNHFGAKGVKDLVPFLKISKHLVHLTLSWNAIRSEGLEDIGTSLEGGSMEELFLQNCAIDSISSLGTCVFPKLKILDLSSNKFGNDGCITLGNLLHAKGSTLKDLRIKNCGIDGEGAEILAKSLTNNASLASLDLAHNEISEGGLGAILDLIYDSSSVTSAFHSNHNLFNIEMTLSENDKEKLELLLQINRDYKGDPSKAGLYKVSKLLSENPKTSELMTVIDEHFRELIEELLGQVSNKEKFSDIIEERSDEISLLTSSLKKTSVESESFGVAGKRTEMDSAERGSETPPGKRYRGNENAGGNPG